MSAENNRKDNSNKIRLILAAIVIVVLVVLVWTGKLDLNQLLGLATEQPGTSAAETKNAGASAAETKAASASSTEKPGTESTAAYVQYYFRNKTLLNQHYDKHGKDMGFANAKDYEKAASDVINNPNALHKTEKEDGDYLYYVEDSNEFVVLSRDGYIRTYFCPDSGRRYFDKQ